MTLTLEVCWNGRGVLDYAPEREESPDESKIVDTEIKGADQWTTSSWYAQPLKKTLNKKLNHGMLGFHLDSLCDIIARILLPK